MILVTGATGSIGTHLVRRLTAAGAPFTALVRDRAKGEALGVDYVVGNFESPDEIAAALRGVEQLFLNGTGAVPVVGEQPMISQHRMVIDAAKAAGVTRVVKVSVWHACAEGKLSHRIHGVLDEYLRSSGINSTILQPSGFMQNFLRGGIGADGDVIGPSPDPRVSYIDAYDIARVGAAILTGEAPFGGTHVLTGPEAISHRQIADKLGAMLHRRVRYVELSSAELTARMMDAGMPGAFATDLVCLWEGMAGGDSAEVTDAVTELTGTPPRNFDAFLAANRLALANTMA